MNKVSVVKGVRFSAVVAPLVSRMELVNDHRESLQRLEDTWDQLALLGQMSDNGTDIASTGAQFHALTGTLLDSLACRLLQDAQRTARATAQTCIDILVRNLYERTADVGFLATDDALRELLATARRGEPAPVDAVRERLRAYASKYSVYDDVVVLDLEGRVVVRLDALAAAAGAEPSLLRAVIDSSTPFVEAFGHFQVLDGRRGLLYGAPVRAAGSGPVIGALCLSFRLEDEMRAIFGALVPHDDPSVALLLDAKRTVVASSDPHQVPVGTVLAAASGAAGTLRFGGREYLAVQTRAAGYQGYAGPGWDACVLVPVDLAFQADPARAAPPVLAEALVAGSSLFGAELQAIPAQARSIQRGLERLVWNGQLRIRRDAAGAAGAAGGAGAPIDTRFAGALLERVTRTGQRISAVFETAIGDLQRSAVASVLEEVRACSALGVDILDRNLYERANDCRWWALDSSLQNAARAGDARASAEAKAVLQRIHGLYTVYAELLLLDAQGRVLAASAGGQPAVSVAEPWLPAALALRGDQAFVRSTFAASPLYGGQPTYVFAAPVQGNGGGGGANAGCVAVVFDSAVQIAAMLRDVLPVDAEGWPLAQASGLFVTRSGTVVASTHDSWTVGARVPFADQLAALPRGASHGLALSVDGVTHAAGITMSSGYREYESTDACGPEDVACVVLIAIGAEGGRQEAGAVARFVPPAPVAKSAERVVLASVRVGDQWLGLPAVQVVEAVAMPPSAGAAAIVMHQEQPLAIIDVQQLRGERVGHGARADGILVVCQDGAGRRFALRVDEVGTVFDLPRSALRELPPGVASHDPIATAVVRGEDGSEERLLTVIRLDTAAASGARAAP
ncbi:chemotaxis protein CheW [Variovorax sp. ZT4R33]|uniref:chemotaxis protein CheW n=1 Tax=Variovorax sp. ZT4R33 TaxID=3443743 RepID=UPI003F44DC8A